MKCFVKRRLVTVLCATGFVGMSTQAMASAFQLWEQDGASVGNYHAGYAAEANDASTAWYNPAGITRIKNQQVVIGGLGILTDFKYRGSVTIANALLPPISFFAPPVTFNSVTSQGGVFSFVPDFHYVLPISDRLGFGFSVDAPFGLKTNYGSSTPLRYAATLTSITVVDVSPSLGFKVTDKASVGLGFDIQRAFAEFDNMAGSVLTVPIQLSDTTSTNKANDTGYGFHLGALYEFTPDLRAGISYHSQVVHHFTGSSKLVGPIATAINGGPVVSNHASTNVTLPPYTALSVYYKTNPQWALLGSLIYTQWSTFQTLGFQNFAGAVADPTTIIAPSTTIAVSIPENYRNTWNASIGADYFATDTITLKGGLGYDETPVQNAYRNVQLPDNDRYVIALGGHFMATKHIGLDIGWLHLFFKQALVNPPPQVTGAQVVTTNGHVSGGADVFSGQITWDIA